MLQVCVSCDVSDKVQKQDEFVVLYRYAHDFTTPVCAAFNDLIVHLT